MYIDFNQSFLKHKGDDTFKEVVEKSVRQDLEKLFHKYQLSNTQIVFEPMGGGYLGNIKLISISSNLKIKLDVSLDYNLSNDAICIYITSNHSPEIYSDEDQLSILEKIKNLNFKSDCHFPLDTEYLIKTEAFLSNLNLNQMLN